MKIYINPEVKTEIEKINNLENSRKNFVWHYLYIIHHIATYRIKNSKFKDEEFVPINVKNLRTKISYNKCSKFLTDLVKYGILKTDNYYLVGVKAKSYKLSEKFKLENFVFQEIEDSFLNTKLETEIFAYKKYLLQDSSAYGKITRNMEKLTINEEMALNYIDKNVCQDKKPMYKISLSMFETKFSVKDTVCNRLHNNLTNLPSCLRHFLSYKSDFLYQLDIKCSQPTFLGLYMLKNSFGNKEEVLEFLNFCKNGTFYNQFLDLETTENRKELKKNIFKYCFFNKSKKRLNKFEKRFKELYPSVFETILNLKQTDYTNLSIVLQKEESRFIFSVVDEVDEYILTIHDSIVCRKQDIPSVKSKMYEKFVELYNFVPELGEEKC